MQTKTEAPALVALRRVAAGVSKMIPKGFTGDTYWDMTVEADSQLMEAFNACMDNDTEPNRDHFRWCASEWVKAWKRAIAAWHADQP